MADAKTNTVKVKMSTNKGDITLELNKEKAPVTVENFLSYVEKGHYNGTIFHRVIPDFMAQGGGFDSNMQEKHTDAPIKNEALNGLKNQKWSISMARTMDLDSATSQFFINAKDNDFLDYPTNGGYAVFGKVVDGFEVVESIMKVKTTSHLPHDDVPVEPIIIAKAEVIS